MCCRVQDDTSQRSHGMTSATSRASTRRADLPSNRRGHPFRPTRLPLHADYGRGASQSRMPRYFGELSMESEVFALRPSRRRSECTA